MIKYTMRAEGLTGPVSTYRKGGEDALITLSRLCSKHGLTLQSVTSFERERA